MSQQLNLFSPKIKPKRKKFDALLMTKILAFSISLIAIVSYGYVNRIDSLTAIDKKILDKNFKEIDGLSAFSPKGAASSPNDDALIRRLKERREEVANKESLLQSAQHGMLIPGQAHSDKLSLISKSIPSQAWITKVKLDSGLFEVSGFTLDPDVLNEWVPKLKASQATSNLELGTVLVDISQGKTDSAGGTKKQTVWSFSLTSQDGKLQASGTEDTQ